MKLYYYIYEIMLFIHKSALHTAIDRKNVEIVKLLLSCERFDINQSSI